MVELKPVHAYNALHIAVTYKGYVFTYVLDLGKCETKLTATAITKCEITDAQNSNKIDVIALNRGVTGDFFIERMMVGYSSLTSYIMGKKILA